MDSKRWIGISNEGLDNQVVMVSGVSEVLTNSIGEEESKDENPLDQTQDVSQVYAEMGREQAEVIKQDKEQLLDDYAKAALIEHIESKRSSAGSSSQVSRTSGSSIELPIDQLDGAKIDIYTSLVHVNRQKARDTSRRMSSEEQNPPEVYLNRISKIIIDQIVDKVYASNAVTAADFSSYTSEESKTEDVPLQFDPQVTRLAQKIATYAKRCRISKDDATGLVQSKLQTVLENDIIK